MAIFNSVYKSFEQWWQPWADTALYYSFNDDTASTVYDWVWNYDGTWENSSWTYEAVQYWKTAIFDGDTNCYIKIPTTFTFPTTDFTISFWTNFTYTTWTASDNPPFFSKRNGNSSTNCYLFVCNTLGKVHVDIPYVAALFESTNAINDGNRHLVVITKSWSNYSLYVDLDNPQTATNSASLHWWSSTQWLIWCPNNQPSWTRFKWKIDEFIVEDVAWSSQDRTDYYNLTKSYFGIS